MVIPRKSSLFRYSKKLSTLSHYSSENIFVTLIPVFFFIPNYTASTKKLLEFYKKRRRIFKELFAYSYSGLGTWE